MTKFRSVVTGGNTGIGAAIAQKLISRGHDVVCLSRRKPEWNDPKLSFVEVDLTDGTATKQAAQDVLRGGPITHIVHNAGVIRAKLLEDVQLEDLAALTQLHLGAAIELAQAALPGMKAARFGRIVLISSRAAMGLQTRTVYSATKAGMIGMARTWALELAPHGITVNVVFSSDTGATEMFESVMSPESERAQALAKSIPVGRLGRSADVARAVDFFCDEAADFVTGQTLLVCGGASVSALSM
ncbi:MAG: SDR family oxidoreductase [Rhodoblastus sp.]|nr:SDR family oxidoreductase [Rhodoblastus sp.]